MASFPFVLANSDRAPNGAVLICLPYMERYQCPLLFFEPSILHSIARNISLIFLFLFLMFPTEASVPPRILSFADKTLLTVVLYCSHLGVVSESFSLPAQGKSPLFISSRLALFSFFVFFSSYGTTLSPTTRAGFPFFSPLGR